VPDSHSIGPIKNKKELAALLDILSATFGFSREQGDQYSKIVGVKNYRVIRDGRTVIGGCALLPLGQFFGGVSVPMIGIAAVGIAPEHRGKRTATRLMQAALREIRERDIPISSLYPATLPLYRSTGYEHAGYRFDIHIPAKSLILKSREDGLEVRRITPRDEATVREVYRRRAVNNNGTLDRSDFIWHRVKQPRGSTATGYLVIDPATSRVEGYTYYLQKESGMPHDIAHSPYSLHLTDLVALTPAAGRRLWQFLANHRSMIHEIVFQGTPDDPILKLLPDRLYSARLLDHWMVRIVDVKGALLARGYPSAAAAEVHLDVHDDLFPDNSGRYVLEVLDGRAKITSGGRGDIILNIRGLASLYTGHLSPHNLLIVGQLGVSSRVKRPEEALATLGSIFAGPAPWLGDMF
jgi:predicted acetyltransferase